ncbi:MAG TPA: ribosome biogenesis GTPase Der [Candidatus Kryptobacter bacterium]|nr:MAG: ribosome biogenesis GTPase Der [Ignavibacteriae bacterium 37-53-5]HQT91677.1 ribosome biogenesis GTPase Der [Candidatus Kryptobacter bacterium]
MSTIAIVGRPNVGKSTLFNRLIGGRRAIVDDKPGVTRDRNYGSFEWRGKDYTVIDTGGFVPDSQNVFEKAIREQAQYAVDEADAIVLVVDGSAGPHPIDNEIAKILRKKAKKVLLVVNKVDDAKHERNIGQFYELGFEKVMGVSAQLGRSVGDFLDEISKIVNDAKVAEDASPTKKIAIVGKPNVGKSSLVNLLLGENRSIVTDVPGTTRDSVDTHLKFQGEDITLIDTAGLRKKSKIKESVEFFSALRTFQAVERCDAAIILFDASIGVEKQDLQIVEYTIEQGKPAIIGVNKWDLVDKKEVTVEDYERGIKDRLRVYDFVPVIFVSVLKKQRVQKLLSSALTILGGTKVKIKTSELNDYLLPLIERTPPFSKTGKEIKIKYITQVESKLPTFAMFTNLPEEVSVTYKRFLENKLREKFRFEGVPIRLVFKQK